MKKTTKILLVLAAVVAMAIGAVSTVMAADDVVISEWVPIDEAKNIYAAKDQNGETIARGWAVSEAGRWYFFDSGKMLFNTFITYNQEIYYLDGTGAMAANAWVGFDKDATNATFDTKVNTVDKYIKNAYDKITDIDGFNGAFEIVTDTNDDVIFVNPLEDGKDKVLWCYFHEDGTMAQNEWVQAFDGLWYYIAGAYCVLGDYSVAINGNTWEGDADFKDSVDGVYGFGPDGAQLYGWNYYDKPLTAAGTGSETDKDTPYYDSVAGTAATTIRIWTYYDMQTGVQVNRIKDTDDIEEGWEKIDGKWCYFIADPDLGMKLLQNTLLTDTNAAADGLLKDEVVDATQTTKKGYFYLDANGYMVTGIKSFAKDAKIATWNEETGELGERKFSEAATFIFDTTLGKMLDGIQGRYYYNFATSQLAADDIVSIIVDADITTSGAITIDTTGRAVATYEGQRVEAKNFFLVTKDVNDLDGDDDKTDKVILYFEHGVWQKNQAISFGEVTIGINANGAVIDTITAADGKVKVAGYTYIASGNDLTVDGVTIVGLKK